VAALAGCLADVWSGGSAAEGVARLRGEAGKWFLEAVPHLEAAMARTATGMRVAAALFEEEVGSPEEIEGILDQAREALVEASLQATQEVVVAQSERDTLVARTRELEEKSSTDGLTGLLNRAAFDTYLADQMASCRRAGTPLSLVLIDVDHFKQVNDRHGHVAGDGVLQRIAQCLRGTHRAKDKPCRYGGEEFAIILPETDGPGAKVVAERLREKIAQTPHVLSPTQTIVVTASFGVVTIPGAGVNTKAPGTPTDLIAAADSCLYEAKHAGRNRVVVWSEAAAEAKAAQRGPGSRATA
jgi:diguanylate cyclase (GGDEF)-like protein